MHSTTALVALLYMLFRTLGWLPSLSLDNLPVEREIVTREEIDWEGELPTRDLYSIKSRISAGAETSSTLEEAPVGERYTEGVETFWIANQVDGGYFPISTTLGCETANAYFWVEVGIEIDNEMLCESAYRFEEKILPVVRRFFGREWKPVTESDGRIHVVNGRIPGVGGYFSSIDSYPRAVNRYSNQGDIIYVNVANATPGTWLYEGTLAHELQHLMHYGQDKDEDSWVNEGASELAMALAGYGDQRLIFASAPDVQLTAWSEDLALASAHYEASYLFLEYFSQRAGIELVPDLIACPANGARGFNEVLGGQETGWTFEDIFEDWVVANYLDDLNLGDGRYGYQGVNVQVAATHTHYLYPLHRSATVHQYAADYIDLELGHGDVEIAFSGSTETRLVAEDPHSGDFHWWSNRGDLANTSLTRDFDLREVSEANLSCWLWYDIEQDYDYAYVEVSEDGGVSWQTMAGRHTTRDDPNGLNLGYGLTGRSGGSIARWVEEVFDLTPYSGREILLRFEYVTDDAYNAEGFCVDDISIPEIGYVDDVEGDEGGWRGEGFVLTNNRVHQRFNVSIIAFGDPVQVIPLPLDEEGCGKAVIPDLGGATPRATLVVAAMAPKTAQAAHYRYSVVPLKP